MVQGLISEREKATENLGNAMSIRLTLDKEIKELLGQVDVLRKEKDKPQHGFSALARLK